MCDQATGTPLKKKNSMYFLVAFISLFYCAGFGILGYGVWAAKRSTEAAEWPTAQGKLVSVELKHKSDGEGAMTYEVLVEYTYDVMGKPYRGSRLAYGYASSSGLESHREIERKLKAAKSVEVRYDPFDPATSVLSFGFHRSIQFMLAFAVTWLAFVFGFTLIWWLASRSDTVLLQNLSVK